MALNRPHFHVWRFASTGRAIFRLVRGFRTRQAARQFAIRRGIERDAFMVLQCSRVTCRPPLD